MKWPALHLKMILFAGALVVSSCSLLGNEQIKAQNNTPPEINTQSPVAAVPPEKMKEPLDYKLVSEVIFQRRCIECHGGIEVRGKVLLTSYEEVLKNLVEIKDSVADNSMPPRRREAMTAAEKKLILDWIASGAPRHVSGPAVSSKDPEQPLLAPPSVAARPPVSALEVETYNRGKYLFQISSCNACHTKDTSKPLSGGYELNTPYGIFLAPNISSDPIFGIGSWSKQQFLKALREGISPSGKSYYPSFPYTNYSKLSDEDILSIQFFLQRQPGYRVQNQKHKLKFPFNQAVLMKLWKSIYFPKIKNQDSENFIRAQGPFQVLTDQSLLWNRGAYLVEGPLHCTTCHTPRDHLGGPLRKKWMGGAKSLVGEKDAPNITPDPTALANWNEKDWKNFLKTGFTPEGDRMAGEMMKIIKSSTSVLTEADLQAVATYMMSLESVSKDSK